ncbi:MAG: hypothetical protein IKV97_05440, partial [Clostridia bacterium]|nr:hypothetical protein [Clostridia bacterium]
MKKRIFSALLAIIMVLSVTGFNANVAAFDLPEGDEHMPTALIIGENVADISENSSGYNFSWTAEQNGTLTLEIVSPDSWTYVVDNLTTSTYGDQQWSDSDPVVNPYSIVVEEGDELRIMVNTYDPYDMFTTPAETITLAATFEADDIQGEGGGADDPVDTDELTQNEDGYYEIGTVSDFEAFATLVNGGEGDIDAVMTADIDISSTNVMIGEFSDFPYMGNFDGANHTLTMDYVIYDEYVAPFRFVESATIENLTVTGEIYTLSKFAAGLVGESKGDTVINNCISDVVINSQVYGDGTHGGLVGVNRESLTMTNCAFVGAMLGEDTDSTGGLVGWTDSDMSMTNCYVAASFETSEYNSNTFVRNYSPIVTLTNCYYINGCGDTRDAIYISSQAVSSGKLAYKLNGNSSDNAVFRQTIGEDEYPNFTGDIVYYNAEDDIYTNTPPASYTITVDEDTLNGTVSAKGQAFAGETVTVTVTADQDYMLSTLIVKNGDIYVPTDGNTFVMPAGNVTVSAIFKLRTELIIGENENTSTTIRMPFESGFCYSVCQYLVPAEKLELIRDKIITDISYFYDAVGDLALDQHVTVYVEEGGSFTNTGNYLPIDNATKIYEGTFDISAETMDIEELQLTLNTPFGYSGGDLLFTVFKQSSDYYDSIAFVSIPSDTASLYSLSDDVDFKNEGFEFADVRSNNVMPKMKFDIVSSDTYSITISDNIENGTVTLSSDSAFAGAKVSLVVTPDEGYIIDTVTYNDGSDHVITPENGAYSFSMPASDVTVSATFRIRESYSITVDDAISFGTVSAPESAFEETTVTLTVTPDSYCILETLTVMQGENVIDVSKDYTFSMPSGDVTVTATFNYPEIRVGGTRIDPTNASDVFGDGKVSYDVETRTLTLNNYTYIGEGVDIIEYGYDNTSAVIYSKNPINLFLIGENSLTHQMQDCNVSMVIYSEKGLTFSGNGSLDATACDAGINSYCIYSEKGDITFNSGTITALAGEAPTSYGVYSVYDINFNGGIVTAYGSHNALMASHIHLTDVELLEPVNGYIYNRWVVDENGEYSEYAKIGPAEKYTISVSDDGNGTVSTNNVTSAIAGKKIHLDIQAEDGYG